MSCDAQGCIELATDPETTSLRPPFDGPRPRKKRGSPGALLLAAVFAFQALTAHAEGFHRGGVGSCAQCHVMHDAEAGLIAQDGTRPLLLAASATDMCLLCHGPTGVFGLDPQRPPRELGGGNFVFLLENNLNDAADGQVLPIAGEAAGHNIVSLSRGTTAESRWDRAPGGTFPSYALGCTSCHDPHGNASFRMLRGAGPVPGGDAPFLNPAPTADGLDVSDPATFESAGRHTAYHAGVSAWCANCHGLYHQENSSSLFEHPVDEVLDSGQRQRYNAYNGDLDPQGGSFATAYLPEVPIEGPTTSVTSTVGAGSTDRFHCLTCHRAHASSAPAAGRWDFRVYRLAEDGVASGSYPLASPYSGADQGQLCRKCHSQSSGHDRGMACVACHSVP
jgi:Zn-finger protein